MKRFLVCCLALFLSSAYAENKMTYVESFNTDAEWGLMNDYYYPLPNVNCGGGGGGAIPKNVEPRSTGDNCLPGYTEYWYFLNMYTSEIKKYQVTVQLYSKRVLYNVVPLTPAELAKQQEFESINNDIDTAFVEMEAAWPSFYSQYDNNERVEKGNFYSKSAPNCAANGNEDADSVFDYFSHKHNYAFRNEVKDFIQDQFSSEIRGRVNGFSFNFGVKEVQIGAGLTWTNNRRTASFATADGGSLAFSIYDQAGTATPVLNLYESKTAGNTRLSDFIVSENGDQPGDQFKLKENGRFTSTNECEAADMAVAAKGFMPRSNISGVGVPGGFDACTTGTKGPHNWVITDYLPQTTEWGNGVSVTTYHRVTTHISFNDYSDRCD
ncbi:MAG: hypothetical protein OQJ89_07195 [Kangiellaceae bacterium]|nr:hypothetical protein [Kangiellaceae bacterium]MCW9016731.1 hypothetical protein [Kangiellaceae bacterium]